MTHLIVAFASAASSPSAELFTRLRTLSQTSGSLQSDYYDMHGNANEDLRALTVGRFSFTAAICAELDAANPRIHPAYVAALYGVLAKVCDPNLILWLEQRLSGNRRNEIYSHWLPGFGTSEKWLVGAEKWSAFLEKWAEVETGQEHRTEVFRAMTRLQSTRTLAFFTRMEKDPKAAGEDWLIAANYLCEHGIVLNSSRLRETIHLFGGSASGKEILSHYVNVLRNELATPWLISVVDQQPEEKYGNAQWILEEITFCRDTQGLDQWQKWAANHLSDGRSVWMREASARLLDLAKSDLPAAKAFLQKAIYRWHDPMMFPTMEKLAEFKPLHSEVVSWINLMYSYHRHVPHLGDRLRVLALKIQGDDENELENWARRLMHGWDFLYEDKTTWEEYNSGYAM